MENKPMIKNLIDIIHALKQEFPDVDIEINLLTSRENRNKINGRLIDVITEGIEKWQPYQLKQIDVPILPGTVSKIHFRNAVINIKDSV